MPDFAVHTIFGEQLLPLEQVQTAIAGEEALTAWRWGLQGPDPLFFRKSTDFAGGAMHRGAPEGMFRAMAACLAGLPEGPARDTAKAWLWGLLAHYVLDRTAHPYVYAKTEEMARRMPEATGNACHYQVETDMDADLWLYAHRRPVSALDPRQGMALHPWQKEVIAGMLAAGAAAKGAALSVTDGMKALDSCIAAQRLIFRGGAPVRAAARGLELLLGRDRQLTSHVKGRAPRWDSLNLGRAPWTDPRDGSTRTQSVPELLAQAQADALPLMEELARRLAQGEPGTLPLGGVDFSGMAQPE